MHPDNKLTAKIGMVAIVGVAAICFLYFILMKAITERAELIDLENKREAVQQAEKELANGDPFCIITSSGCPYCGKPLHVYVQKVAAAEVFKAQPELPETELPETD